MSTNKLHNNTSGFKTPDQYFEGLEDRIMAKTTNTKLNSGFKTPETYFDGLEDNILNTVNTTKTETKVVPLWAKKQWVYIGSIAASLALLITLTFNNTATTTDFSSLTETDLETYILNNDELDNYDLASLYNTDELNTETDLGTIISDTNLDAYIEDNSDDINNLILD